MAKLFFKYGTMKSGKSMHLLMTAHNYESQGKQVLLYTSAVDDRWGESIIRSRVGVHKVAKVVTDKIYDDVLNCGKNISCILVDEAQFLEKEDIINLSRIVDDLNIPVICYGLKDDFNNNLFEGSKTLLEMADDIEYLKTVCEHPDCGKKATMNLRFVDGKPTFVGDSIQIGDSEYKPVCRKHFFHYDR